MCIYIYIYIWDIVVYTWYYIIPHRIHGAGIYANISGILMGSMLPYGSTMDPMAHRWDIPRFEIPDAPHVSLWHGTADNSWKDNGNDPTVQYIQYIYILVQYVIFKSNLVGDSCKYTIQPVKLYWNLIIRQDMRDHKHLWHSNGWMAEFYTAIWHSLRCRVVQFIFLLVRASLCSSWWRWWMVG